MDDERLKRRAEELSAHTGPEALPTPDLLQQISSDAKSLVQLEVELAKEEARVDVKKEIDLAKGAVVGALCAIFGLNMLLIACVFALAPESAPMVAAIIGVVLLLIGGGAAFIGWKRAEMNPLHTTRNTLKEDLEWAKRQLR
jgi:uncharacterized membrane protein YqjE